MNKIVNRNLRFLVSFVVMLLFAATLKVSGQEQILPLGTNPVLLNAAKAQKENPAAFRTTAVYDTLILPFVDDFSRPGIYPFDSLWLDSNVFINTNYADLPITIGVATFDGLNQYGLPHNPAASVDSVGDNLTSRPIDLGVLAGDTSIWLSFFYQPQGLGDVPENGDSLVLQMRDTGGVWNNIWALPGKSDTVFQRANIHILDAKYFYRGFQFRFYNIATINGNRDHWNLDYVILRKDGAPNDSILDRALVYPQTTILNEFTAMPYPHYKSLGTQILAAMKSTMNDTLYNINYGNASFEPKIDIFQNGTNIFTGSALVQPTASLTFTPYTIPLTNFSYPVQSTDSIDFLIKSYISIGGFASNTNNDTSYFTQHFHNYYAYDDGSAEVAYGLTGNLDVEMAYKFDVKMQDTLVGAQIYFNPVGVDVTNKLFQLVAWSSVDVGSNSDVRIRTTYDLKPGTNDSINGFKTFVFDTVLIVNPGTLFIGIEQNEPATQYGIGLDRNTDSRSKMFYHLDGFWHQSNVKGSWMIRPIFGKHISLVGIDEVAQNNFDFSVYPNPATNKITIELPFDKKSRYQILNLIGEVINEDAITSIKTISVDDISSGIYFVRIINENNFSSVKKIVIN